MEKKETKETKEDFGQMIVDHIIKEQPKAAQKDLKRAVKSNL